MSRLLIALPLIVILALAGLFFIQLESGDDPSRIPSALIGKPAPALALEGLAGKPGFGPGELADGRVKIVNFWASWCAPCRVEHPVLMGLAETDAVKQGKVALVGMNYKDEAENARRFLGALGNPYSAVGVDRPGRAAIEWGVYGVPETFVIDKSGTIRLKHIGPVTPEVLRDTILPLVKKLNA